MDGQSECPYAVVEFPEEGSCEVVPTSWLTRDKSQCRYPKIASFKITKLIRNRTLPPENPKDTNWGKHQVRNLTYTDSFEKARRKATFAEYTSNVESEVDLERLRKSKHRHIAPTIDTSSDEVEVPRRRQLHSTAVKRTLFLDDSEVTVPHSSLIPNSLTKLSKKVGEPNLCLAPGSGILRKNKTKESGPSKLSQRSNLAPIVHPNAYAYVSSPGTSFLPSPRQRPHTPQPKRVEQLHPSPLTTTPTTRFPVPTTCSSPICRDNLTKFQSTVLRALSVIQQNLNILMQANQTTNITLDGDKDLPVYLPLQTIVDFNSLNEWLADISNKNFLVHQLRLIGGGNLEGIVRGLLLRLIGPGLNSCLNFSGKFNKAKLKETLVHNVILETTRSSNLGKEATDNQVKSIIQKWLKSEANLMKIGHSSIDTETRVDSLGYTTPNPNTKNSPTAAKSFQNLLRQWSFKHKISHAALSDLLKLLHASNHDDLPLDSRTFLKTPKSVSIESLAGGEFAYFGIQNYFNKVRLELIGKSALPLLQNSQDLVSISIGIDGVPISRSTNACFWPILGSCDQLSQKEVFIIALFQGNEKPNSIYDYLAKLVAEINYLEVNNVKVGSRMFNFRVSTVIADAPARAFIKQCKSFNAFHGCERCTTEGHYNGRVVYLDLDAPVRNSVTFRNQSDPDHHVAESPFIQINIDMVYNFPLDYMHLVCLGVTRKLLYNWVFGKVPHKWNFRKVCEVTRKLITLKPYIPEEFARKPRTLRELKNFKATEYRLFLLYTGIVVLKGMVTDDEYKMVLLLQCSIYILLSEKAHDRDWNAFASALLKRFVTICSNIYGPKFLVYNVHSILHLPDDALRYGSLDNCSAFPFENYMQILKGLVRKNHQQLSQVTKRLHERHSYNHYEEYRSGFVSTSFPCTQKYIYKNVSISNRIGNNCFLTKQGLYVVVKGIDNAAGSVTFKCQVLITQSVNDYPCDSIKVGICLCDLSDSEIVLSCNDFLRKCVLLPCWILIFKCK